MSLIFFEITKACSIENYRLCQRCDPHGQLRTLTMCVIQKQF